MLHKLEATVKWKPNCKCKIRTAPPFAPYLPIIASQNLSSSSLSSDSVGSTINVPTTGHDVVGEWKPEIQLCFYETQHKAPFIIHNKNRPMRLCSTASTKLQIKWILRKFGDTCSLLYLQESKDSKAKLMSWRDISNE